MLTYSAYTFRIASGFPIPALEASGGWSADGADVTVREVDRDAMAGRYREERERPGGHLVVSHYDNEVHYAVRGGREIELYRSPGVAEDFMARCVISLPLAIALRQRGLTTFHGCAVARDGVAVAFMGPSGAGKSTLAEAFYQRGYDVFSDDLFVLRFDGDTPVALPGPTHIRLREGSGRALVDDYDRLPLAWSESAQRFRDVGDRPRRPAPLRRVYLVNDASAERTRVDPIDGLSATMTLAAQTWAYNRFSDPAYTTAHMDRLADLVTGGFVVGLLRVRGLDAIDETVRVVEADAGLAAPPEPTRRAGRREVHAER